MERAFGTLQNRLPPELRLAGATIEAANRYLKQEFVPDYNARFAVPAEEEGSAFIAYAGRPLADILCLQESRQVGRDNCVTWNRLALQIPPQRHRHHTSRPPCGCTNTPTASSPSSTGRAASPGSTTTESRSMSRGPLNSARRPGLWICGQRPALPTTPQAHQPQQRTYDGLRKTDIFTRYRHPSAPNAPIHHASASSGR